MTTARLRKPGESASPARTPADHAPAEKRYAVRDRPAYRDYNEHTAPRIVMSPPRYLSTAISNNVFMKQQPVDRDRAMRQFRRIKNVLKALGREVLEIPPVPKGQDQTYVANIAVAIDPVIVLAHYKAPGRDVEVPPARKFFQGLGYDTIVPPYYFEGEADLKKFRDDLYFGGWGQFSDPKAFDWIEDQTGVSIVRLHEVSKELYHLDCSLMVLDDEHVIVVEEGLDKASLRTLEQHAELVIAPKGLGATGITNGVKIPEKKLYLSGAFQPETKDYRKAAEWLHRTFDDFGYTVILLDTDEADKSGADLSCMVMHLDFEPPRCTAAPEDEADGAPEDAGDDADEDEEYDEDDDDEDDGAE